MRGLFAFWDDVALATRSTCGRSLLVPLSESMVARAFLLLCVVGAFALSNVSCSPFQVQSTRFGVPLSASLPVLVISEPQIGYVHTPAEEYVRTLVFIEALGGTRDVAVVAPWEVEVLPGQAWPSGDALGTAALADQGIDPDGALMVSIVLEHSATGRVVVPTASMVSETTSTYTADAVLHVIAREVRGREVVARVEIAFEDDPFAPGGELGDTHPRFTEALRRAGAALRSELDAVFVASRPRSEAAPTFRYGATDLMQYGAGGAPAGAGLDALDALDQAASRLVWHRRVEPGLSPAIARAMDEVGPSLFVEESRGAALAAGIQAGDLIVEVDERPARGPQVWTRAFTRPGLRTDVPVRVIRGGESMVIWVPTAS